VRPAYTLGGTGGGIAATESEFLHLVKQGWLPHPSARCSWNAVWPGEKEIEFEVIRDATGEAITVCGMENLDPMESTTGDSIVVAPTQTLSADQYHLLRRAAIHIVSTLGIAGGCNVQLALEPGSLNYYVIEVNPG